MALTPRTSGVALTPRTPGTALTPRAPGRALTLATQSKGLTPRVVVGCPDTAEFSPRPPVYCPETAAKDFDIALGKIQDVIPKIGGELVRSPRDVLRYGVQSQTPNSGVRNRCLTLETYTCIAFIRDVLNAGLQEKQTLRILDFFGRDCVRIARVRVVLEASLHLKHPVGDERGERMEECLAACAHVEKLYEDMGFSEQLRIAQSSARDAQERGTRFGAVPEEVHVASPEFGRTPEFGLYAEQASFNEEDEDDLDTSDDEDDDEDEHVPVGRAPPNSLPRSGISATVPKIPMCVASDSSQGGLGDGGTACGDGAPAGSVTPKRDADGGGTVLVTPRGSTVFFFIGDGDSGRTEKGSPRKSPRRSSGGGAPSKDAVPDWFASARGDVGPVCGVAGVQLLDRFDHGGDSEVGEPGASAVVLVPNPSAVSDGDHCAVFATDEAAIPCHGCNEEEEKPGHSDSRRTTAASSRQQTPILNPQGLPPGCFGLGLLARELSSRQTSTTPGSVADAARDGRRVLDADAAGAVRVEITGEQASGGVLWYVLEVHERGNVWYVRRRFKQFDSLDRSLRKVSDNNIVLPDLPPKGIFGIWHRLGGRDFNERRREGLKLYLSRLLEQVQPLSVEPRLEEFLSASAPGNGEESVFSQACTCFCAG